MLAAVRTAIGVACELGEVVVDDARVARYRAALDLPPAPRVPLGLALSLCGGRQPAVEFTPDVVTVHAGHLVRVLRPVVTPARYRLTARIRDICEKSGRSGHLLVIARHAEIRDEAGELVVTVDQSEIARRQPSAPASPAGPRPAVTAVRPASAAFATGPIALGETILSESRQAPDAVLVGRYAATLNEEVPFFTDAGLARAAGFAGVIVPGPVQSALFEELIATRFPAWTPREIHLTFRLPVLAGEVITFTAVVTEHEDTHVVLDLTIENGTGDRAAVGTATLAR